MKKTIFAIVLSFVPISLVLANNCGTSGLDNPIGICNMGDIVTKILGVFSAIGAIFVVLAIIYSGFLFVTAQGNPEKIKQAKDILFWVIIGAIVLLGAEALSRIIMSTARDLGVRGV